MKKNILIVSILSTIQFSFAQTGSPPALAINPPTTQTTSNFAWYRGGNNPTGPAGVNNIFGTRWASDI